MQLIRKLLSSVRPKVIRNGKTRGLSTAELVGIIVIVGILGALGGTYITGLITASKDNTGSQNAQSLTTVYTSAINAGATTDGTGVTADLTAGKIQNTAAGIIADLTTGVTVSNNGNAVVYRVNPPIAAGSVGNYTFASGTFSHTAGTAP